MLVAVKVLLNNVQAVMAVLVELIRTWVLRTARKEQPLVAELAMYMVRLYVWPTTRFRMIWEVVE